MAMSEVRARVIATQAINEAVSSELTYKIKYEDLFIIKTDKDNKVTMLQANTMVMNRIATETALNIQERLRQMGVKRVGIPFGSILGSNIFANYGPRLNVEILPVGTVSVNFATDFEQAGINQTRHKIYLIIKTQVKIIVPLVSNRVDVVTQVPIAETIIVGDIPQNYIYVPEREFMNVVPDSVQD
jgi:sporulation protein YunB